MDLPLRQHLAVGRVREHAHGQVGTSVRHELAVEELDGRGGAAAVGHQVVIDGEVANELIRSEHLVHRGTRIEEVLHPVPRIQHRPGIRTRKLGLVQRHGAHHQPGLVHPGPRELIADEVEGDTGVLRVPLGIDAGGAGDHPALVQPARIDEDLAPAEVHIVQVRSEDGVAPGHERRRRAAGPLRASRLQRRLRLDAGRCTADKDEHASGPKQQQITAHDVEQHLSIYADFPHGARNRSMAWKPLVLSGLSSTERRYSSIARAVSPLVA